MNRKLSNTLFVLFSWLGVSICAIILLFLLSTIAWNGIQAIRFEFLLTASRNFGSEGGILYQIIGSLLLITFAALFSFPIALATAIYKSEYMESKFHQKMCGALIYSLNGIPSIIFGIFGLIFFVNILNTGISWFVGSIILAMMILPTIVLSTYQSINSIPTAYRENALALGHSKWQVITKVILPQGIGGAITGLLIGLARAIGETAPIMFIATAYSGVEIPNSIFEPVTALPTHILILAQQAIDPKALQNAWGSSMVLVFLVTIFGLLALYSRKRLLLITQR